LTACRSRRVGIKEVDDGIWIVSFMHYDLGYIDLEQKTLQPLGNPFGARLLPMSWVRTGTYEPGPYSRPAGFELTTPWFVVLR
jgi:hypothetical protein